MAVERAAAPYLVVSEESLLDSLASPRRLGHAVARAGDAVVGVARLGSPGPDGEVSLKVVVHPDHRGRGAGATLLAWAEERVGPQAALTGIADERSLPVVEGWGFMPARAHTMAAVDPRTVTPEPRHALTLVDLTTAGPEAAWAGYQAAAGDDPSGLSLPMPYDEFLVDEWHAAQHRPDLGRAVLVDGQVAALAMVVAAGDRAWNAFTGTHPRHRGGGLALAVKRASLVAQAAAGITTCGTGNDDANAAMLAVNRRLGYHRVATVRSVRRDR